AVRSRFPRRWRLELRRAERAAPAPACRCRPALRSARRARSPDPARARARPARRPRAGPDPRAPAPTAAPPPPPSPPPHPLGPAVGTERLDDQVVIAHARIVFRYARGAAALAAPLHDLDLVLLAQLRVERPQRADGRARLAEVTVIDLRFAIGQELLRLCECDRILRIRDYRLVRALQ